MLQNVDSSNFNALTYSLFASIFTWAVTAFGASFVFIFSNVSETTLNAMYSFASGVMIASSCFGLIEPALKAAEESTIPHSLSFVPAVLGMFLAYIFFYVFECFLHYHLRTCNTADLYRSVAKSQTKFDNETKTETENELNTHSHSKPKAESGMRRRKAENGKITTNEQNNENNNDKNGKRSIGKNVILLLSAITLHNLPEGLAVGIAFGSYQICLDTQKSCPVDLLKNAIVLTLGIALQNFPEGIAVAFPLRKCGVSVFSSFWYGQLSAVVEPIGAVIGALLTTQMQNLLPYFLGFAAGAMLFVTVGEMIPEAFKNIKTRNRNNFAFLGGFVLMMVLEGLFE